MSKPYSSDIRKRVIKCFKRKMKYKNISKRLDLSLSTIKRYAKKYKNSGNIDVKNEVKTGRKPSVKDFYKLQEFIENNHHLSLEDMAAKLNISKSSLHRAIIKLNFTFKKSRGYIKKEMKKKDKNFCA